MNNNIKIFLVLFFFTNSNYSMVNEVKNTKKSVFSIFNSFVVRFPMIKQRDFSSLSTLPKEFYLNSLESRNSIDQKIVNNIDNNVINKNKNYFRVGMPRPVQGSILISQGIGNISNHKVNSPKINEFSNGKDINKATEISKIIESVEAFRPALVKDLIKHWHYRQETANLFVDFLSNAMVSKNAVHRNYIHYKKVNFL
jgi:hypothetical protein